MNAHHWVTALTLLATVACADDQDASAVHSRAASLAEESGDEATFALVPDAAAISPGSVESEATRTSSIEEGMARAEERRLSVEAERDPSRSLARFVDGATGIAHVRCISADARAGAPDEAKIVTDVEFETVTTFRGALPLRHSVPGGHLGDQGRYFAGRPVFQIGHYYYVFYLDASPPAISGIVSALETDGSGVLTVQGAILGHADVRRLVDGGRP